MSAAECLIASHLDARCLLRWLRGREREDAWLVSTYSRSMAANDDPRPAPVVRVVPFGVDLRGVL